MDLAEVIDLCVSLAGAEETQPFGPDVLVYKVGGKMFALTAPEDVPARVNLKCDPERALDLRDQYEAIQPGWHMNKKHWNTVVLDGSVPAAVVRELVAHSYRLVVASLPARTRASLPESA